MQDVVIVGGGLSGLASAWELEQRGLPYTLIEVKGQLGGSISSERLKGFILDGGPFALTKTRDWPWLADLGLEDSLFELTQTVNGRPLVAFKQGSQTLVDALAARLKHGRLMLHMAVSTLGEAGHGFALCLENGMVMQASALIIAAPARYTERMFHSFQPEISAALRRFHYDLITRVSLGYPSAAIPIPIPAPPDVGFAFAHWTESDYRVPMGHVLVQVGVRWPLDRTSSDTLVSHLQQDMHWPTDPVIARVNYWRESHCLNVHDPDHVQTIAGIEQHLPPGVVLIGSDYRGLRFEDRVEQGRAAAVHIARRLEQ